MWKSFCNPYYSHLPCIAFPCRLLVPFVSPVIFFVFFFPPLFGFLLSLNQSFTLVYPLTPAPVSSLCIECRTFVFGQGYNNNNRLLFVIFDCCCCTTFLVELGRVYIKQTAVKEVSGFCNIQWCSVCMDFLIRRFTRSSMLCVSKLFPDDTVMVREPWRKRRGTEQLQVVLQSTCDILLLALLLVSLFCLVPRPGDLLLLQEVLIQCNLRELQEAILFFSLDKASSHDAWCSVLQRPLHFISAGDIVGGGGKSQCNASGCRKVEGTTMIGCRTRTLMLPYVL